MTTGVVTSVTPRRAGGTLLLTTLSNDTVLELDDTADFDETFDEARYLVIGDETTPREYVAVANDEGADQTVTLADPVGAVLEESLPVTPWDPDSDATDKRAIEYQAWVRLDDQDKAIPATVPHAMIPTAGEFSLVGASVRLEETDDGEWFVANVLGREASLVSEVESLVFRHPSGNVAGVVGDLSAFGDAFLERTLGFEFRADDAAPGEVLFRMYDGVPDLGVGPRVDINTDIVLLGVNQFTVFSTESDIYGHVDFKHDVEVQGSFTYVNPPTTSAGANVNINTNTKVVREVTSSRRYKQDIEPAVVDMDAFLRLSGSIWRDKAEVEEDPDTDRRHIGFIAEELHDLGLTEYLTYNADGEPEAVQYDRLTVPLLEVVKRQEKRLQVLERALGIDD